MSDNRADAVKPELLMSMGGEPEPSVDGDWYLLPLARLAAKGYTHIEIHFDTDATRPNAIDLIKYRVTEGDAK